MPLLVLLVTWLVISVISPNFRGVSGVYSAFEGLALMGLIALGLAVTIIGGELDLSVGSMAALAGVLAVKTASLGLVQAILIAVAVGILFGML